MTTGKLTTPSGETIEIDMSGMEKRVEEKMKKYMTELKDYKPKDKDGKGVIESFRSGNATKIVEELRNVRNWPYRSLKEQWTIAIPALTTKETAAHLRDYVFVSDIVKGNPGEDVNIPYVKDFDFDEPTSVGSKIGTVTDLIGVAQTTLKEAGKWSDIPYGDIEKINQNLLDEINRTFAHAAVRAEDMILLNVLDAGTTASYAGQVDHSTKTAAIAASCIPEAIGKLLLAGKEVHPGDCVCVMTPSAYAAFLEEISGSAATAYGFARPDVIQKGVIEDWLGVRILVTHHQTTVDSTLAGTTAVETMWLMRAKRCLALAPKRDILIETDRQIKERKLRIAGSHTFGAVLLDAKEAVRILTSTVVP